MAAVGDRVGRQARRVGYRECAVQSRLQGPAYLFLLLTLLCAPPRAMAADVNIAAVVGFTDTFQPGRWTPLNVTVTNHGDDLNGELEVQVTGGDELRGRRFVAFHRRKLEIQRDSRKSLQFTVFAQSLSYPLVIRVRSNGRERARTQIDLRPRFSPERLLLVLSRDAHLDYLNDAAVNSVRVLYPHPALLPAHWRGYDAVSAVIVHGVSLERLSAAQFDALHKWVAQGGILAVSGGPDYALLRTPRLAGLLPGLPVGMTPLDAASLQGRFSPPLDVSRPVHVHRLGAFRGRVRLRAGDMALVVERTLGLGRVLYLTFDVAGYPFDRWNGMRDLWLDTLRLPPATAAFHSAAEPQPESPLPALIRAESADFPSHATLLYFLALYLGLLLAGYRLPVRRMRLRRLAALWTWAAPVLFAPAAWLLFGPAAFPRDATAVTMAVIEPFPDSIYARLDLDLGLYAHRRGALRLEYRGVEPALQPSHAAQRPGDAGDWVFGEGVLRFVEPRDRRRYVLHTLQGEDVIAFHVEASVHDEAMGPRLALDNASGRTLEDVWLVFDGYAYELGSVAAGARVQRRLARRAQGVEVGAASWRRVLRPPPGFTDRMLAPMRIALERKSLAAGNDGYPGPGQALVLAYTASPFRPTGGSARWSRQEGALVAFQVAASPGDAPANKTGTGPPAPDDDELARRAHAAAIGSASAQWNR